jgi:hypothetical protein
MDLVKSQLISLSNVILTFKKFIDTRALLLNDFYIEFNNYIYTYIPIQLY